jgi:hypothetical protein
MTPLASTEIQFGHIAPLPFASTGTTGDWLNSDRMITNRITFPTPFPPTLASGAPSKGKIRVIVTPTFTGDAAMGNGLAVVPIVAGIDETGFDFSARSSDPRAGKTGFAWLAILEGVQTRTPRNVHFGASQAHPIGKASDPGGAGDRDSCWTRWLAVPFSAPLAAAPTTVLTAHDLVDPGRWDGHTTAAVGCVGGSSSLASTVGFGVQARSIDREGQTGFYYAAVDGSAPVAGNAIMVESGSDMDTDEDIGGHALSPGGVDGDWHYFDFYFKGQFSTPPVVLGVSTNDAVVAVAQRVTTCGFTMAVRNADSVSSFARFNWVAFGCGVGCG